MNVKFNIQYCTVYGEEVLLNIAPTVADEESAQDLSQYQVIAMSTHNGKTWSVETQLDTKKPHATTTSTVFVASAASSARSGRPSLTASN